MNTLSKRYKPEERKVNSSLEILDIVTGECTHLCELDYLIEAPNWTKDGGTLIYNAGGLIYSYDLTTGTHRSLDTSYCIECNNDHVISPDGESIAVSHHTIEDGQSRIYIFPLTGGMPKLITPMAPSYLHGWSPDGETLAYCAERNGEYDVYTIPVDGGEETQLTDVPGLNDGPEYAPNGKHIWFNSVRSGFMQIYRMDVDGHQMDRLYIVSQR
jgi:TolB protein